MKKKYGIPIQFDFAKELRKNQTPCEVLIWNELRNRKLLGHKFLRQHPILVDDFKDRTNFYIADFYCAQKKLVIEIDGATHNDQAEYDEARNFIMNSMRLKVLRITNDEILIDLQNILDQIKSHL